MKRQFILVGVLAVLVVISIVVWTTMSPDTVESAQVDTVEKIKCHACGHEFEMTIQEQAVMLSEGKGLQCPQCQAWSAAPAHVDPTQLIGLIDDNKDDGEGPVVEDDIQRELEDKPPAPGLGVRRKGS